MKLIEHLKNAARICRPQQWYKNLLVFIAVFFSGNLLNYSMLLQTVWGFFALCLVSSSYYILNDIIDRNKDMQHPEKKNRPLASGKLKVWHAMFLMILLLASSLTIAYAISTYFLYAIIFLFVFTQLYSLWLKREVYADVIAIAINFVVKSVSGAFIIDVEISPWLIVCAFFLALFLVYGKRKSELEFLNEKEYGYKNVLKKYSVKVLDAIVQVNMAVLVVAYSFYCFLSGGKWIMLTLPVVVYALSRYLGFIHSGSIIARNPEKVFKDKRMLISMALWLLIAFLSVYASSG